MDLLIDYPLNVFTLANAVLLLAVAIALLRFERRATKIAELCELASEPRPQEDREPQEAVPHILERRLAIMHQRLNELSARFDEGTAMPAVRSEPHLFSHAVRMARNGAGADELVRVCGLSKSEAGLVSKLHGRRIRH